MTEIEDVAKTGEIILGLDPGYRISGWGLIRRVGDRSRFVDCGHIAMQGLSLSARARRAFEELSALLARHRPHAVAIESAFVDKNANSALKLGLIRGVLIAAVVRRGLDVTEYAPTEVKRSTTGRGRASKEQVEYMVRALLGLDARRVLQRDASDALAVAMCHAHKTLPRVAAAS